MKKINEDIKEIYEIFESLKEGKEEKLDLFSKDEEIILSNLEKIKFNYFKKGFIACLLWEEENTNTK